jgi:predicted AAA+ superfamily ATPase
MSEYSKRIVDNTIEEYLETFGAIIIEGARATGKTTTAQNAAASSISLDKSPAIAALAQTDPSTVFSGDVPRLIDEWQLAPNVWNAVRHEVDSRKSLGQFILTGSAAPNNDVTRHSGGGRFGRIRLRTMSLFESKNTTNQIDFRNFFKPGTKIAGVEGPDVATYANRIIIGGWPLTQNMSEQRASLYLRNYIEDVARVDVGEKSDPERVKSLIRSLSRNISTEASLKNVAGESKILDDNALDDTNQSISIPTVRKYLDNLSKIFVLEELSPWSTHIRSKVRQRVSPKWHFLDPSIAAASLQISSEQLLKDPNTLGYFFESLCIRDLRVYASYLGGNVSYYRDEKNLEVDAIVELFNGKWAGFEIKLGGDNYIEEGAENLKSLFGKLSASKQADMTSLNVLTAGNTSYKRKDGVNVVSLGHIGFVD